MGVVTFTLNQLLLLLPVSSAALNTPPPFPSSPSASLCPARTVNYITHSLPQQCLATDLAVTVTTQEYHTNTANGTVALSGDPLVAFASDRPLSSEIAAATVDSTTLSPTAPSKGPLLPTDPASPAKPTTNELAQVAGAFEDDSALESGNFLSFDEWKKQNLKKAGQSEHIGRRNQVDAKEHRNRHGPIQNSLESLGDDGEIDLDFSGFVPGGPDHPARELSLPIAEKSSGQTKDETASPPAVLARSKDAGTTCKERFNFASFDCAANVLKTNKEAESPNTVLVENKDSYMLNQCSAQEKFIILELCNDILIDTVVLANFEFFSSTFRTFRVSVSDRYPVKVEKWKTVGTYEARNSREVQAFLVEDPVIWARYLRIDFLSHYGKEFYCPVSLVRIHGTTMMEDYKHDLELAMEDDVDENEQQSQDEGAAFDALIPEAIAEPLRTSTHVHDITATVASASGETFQPQEPAVQLQKEGLGGVQGANTASLASLMVMDAIMSVIESSDTCSPAESPTETQTGNGAMNQQPSSYVEEPTPALSASTSLLTGIANSSQSSASSVNMSTTKSPGPDITKNTTDHLSNMNTAKTAPPTASSSNTTSQATESIKSHITSSSDFTGVKISSSTTERPKSSTSTQVQPAVPTMQDSFFKSVQKRLQMLEMNSSMSLQYIEDQSRALRDAFKKVEQRQLSRTSAFLDQLNQTVLYELREFRQQYDQLWQSTVIELQMQRERYERDNEAINTRIGILADEVIFQRRMAILQMILILVCLVLVLFSRGAINNYLELPLVQNVLAKSPSSRWLNLSVDSLSRPAQPVRTRSAYQLRAERSGILKGHQRMQSEDSITDTQSGTDVYAPPTPVSDYGQSEAELTRERSSTPTFESDKDDSKLDNPEFDPATIERPATSPPAVRVNGCPPILNNDEVSEEELIDAKIASKSNSLPNGSESPSIVNGDGVHLVKHLSWKMPES